VSVGCSRHPVTDSFQWSVEVPLSAMRCAAAVVVVVCSMYLSASSSMCVLAAIGSTLIVISYSNKLHTANIRTERTRQQRAQQLHTTQHNKQHKIVLL
jgi:hypothetical protein